MPTPLLASKPRLRLGDQERPDLSAALQSCVLSQRTARAAWLADIDLHAVRTTRSGSPKRKMRGIVVTEFEANPGGGSTSTPEEAQLDPDWLEGRMLREGSACALLLGEAVLFTGKVVSVTLRLPQGGAPAVRLTCKGTAPGAARSDAIVTLQHGRGLQQAELDFTTASPTRVHVKGTAEGAGLLRPGGSVELAGLGSAFGGRYRLGAVSWRWDAEAGATSDFEGRRLAPPVR